MEAVWSRVWTWRATEGLSSESERGGAGQGRGQGRGGAGWEGRAEQGQGRGRGGAEEGDHPSIQKRLSGVCMATYKQTRVPPKERRAGSTSR